MAEDKKTTKPGAVPEYERRNFRRGIIVFFVALFILGSIAWGGWVLKGRLFQENRYFILRNIEITSSLGENSRWSGDNAVDDLAAIMGVVLYETNLFGTDLAAMRDRAISNCPGIEKITIARELPDTLQVNIVERMPLAVILFTGPDGRQLELKENIIRRSELRDVLGTLMVDSKSVLMSQKDCAPVNPNLLPQIVMQAQRAVSGAAVDVRPGDTLNALNGAIALLNEAKLRTKLEIKSIVMDVKTERLEPASTRKYIVRFHYDDVIGSAVLPPTDNVIKQLDVLESAIEQSIRTNNVSSIYNLMFENQVIQN